MKKREHKYRMHQVSIDQEESAFLCERCKKAATEGEWSRWCQSCRIDWEDEQRLKYRREQ